MSKTETTPTAPPIEERVAAIETLLADVEGRLTGALAAFIQQERATNEKRVKEADARDERRTIALESSFPLNRQASDARDVARTVAFERQADALAAYAYAAKLHAEAAAKQAEVLGALEMDITNFVNLFRDYVDAYSRKL